MNQKDLNEVLRLHGLWRNKKKGGVRASLSNERLEGANLYGAILTRANLKDANLSCAILKGADLTRANLEGAILEGANLEGAILEGANLSCANLSCANLTGADLKDANLTGADLTRANLTGANLADANLTDAILPEFQIPQSGDLTGFKKVRDGVILELLIPDGTRRTSSLIGNKCRCERAFVVRALNSDLKVFRSIHDPAFVYRVGELVEEMNYNPDPREECLSGIHFFQTEKEAGAYRE